MADTKRGMPIKTVGTETVAVTGGTNEFKVNLGTNVSLVDGGTNVFNVSTGTNTVTISGDVTADVTNTVTISSGTNTLTVDGGSNVFNVTTGTNVVSISGEVSSGTNTLSVATGSNVVIANLYDGTNKAIVDTNGALKIAGEIEVTPEVTVPVMSFSEGSVTNTGTLTVNYTVTDTKVFQGLTVTGASASALKGEVFTIDGTNDPVKKFAFLNLAGNTVQYAVGGLKLTGSGTDIVVRLTLTNLDDTNDMYATIQGIEK